MTNTSRSLAPKIARASFATLTAGAMVMASAAPALAQDRGGRDRGGISAGEVIAGALVLGGIAAVVAAATDNDNDRFRGRYRDQRRGGFGRGFGGGFGGNNVDLAVDRCIRAAERRAQRWTGQPAEVFEIRDVDRERRGFEVKGRIAVREGFRGRGRGRGGDRWDEGRFNCDFRNGQVVDLDFRGIRGL